MMNIKEYSYAGEGMGPVYRNTDWMVGIKNFKPANALENMDSLERHNETDELFALIEGSCTLVYANEENEDLIFDVVRMEKGILYSIPAKLWHNTVTEPNTKMLLIEKPNTSSANSDVISLTENHRKGLIEAVNK